MKKWILAICVSFSLIGCSEKKQTGELPVIDVVNNVGNYQRVYCSDYFSSLELIPLETIKECLLNEGDHISFTEVTDSCIFKVGSVGSGLFSTRRFLYVFDRMGKFLYQIGDAGRGPGEYNSLLEVFLNHNKTLIYISDYEKILEYEFSGKFIRSFRKPNVDGINFSDCSYAGGDLFVGQLEYNGKRKYKYGLFDQNGDTVKCFPSHIYFDRDGKWTINFDGALKPIQVNNQLYLKDFVNDTLYLLRNSNMQPVYVFDFGKYFFPLEILYNRSYKLDKAVYINSIVGMPNYFFYTIVVPKLFTRPKARKEYFHGQLMSDDTGVYGIYNIAKNTNILLDVDQYHQKGFINDINGGLSFIPRYYAGNGIVVDVWKAEDMKKNSPKNIFQH